MNGKDMNYVATMYDALQHDYKYLAENSAMNLGISFQAATRVYQDMLASGKSGFQDFVEAMDTAFYSRFHADEKEEPEVAPIIHGRWIAMPNSAGVNPLLSCSVCGIGPTMYPFNFCPHCGAKMDAKETP